ncbi:MAG: hypothetical protein H6981_15400 [Gammaproteobacteria bacterium]|nr:hypothetical protein [Gammaproteobacteria bacterium]MCP5138172.1 hypothetical protein [Gammaproteobacteria bacterium]
MSSNLFTVTAPLMIRSADGGEHVIAELFEHPLGILWFEPYWHLGDPKTTLHLVEGEVRGEGPWRVADHILNVLGCHGTNAELAIGFERWREFLLDPASDYPPVELVKAIARHRGAITD